MSAFANRLLLALVASTMTAAGCNKVTRSEGPAGSLTFALTVPGVKVDTVHWTVQQGMPPSTVRQGDLAVPQNGTSASFLVTGLQPGAYQLSLSANALPNATQPDPVACAGNSAFTITAGTTTHTSVLLVCTQTPTQGHVAIDTTVQFEDCPYVTSFLVSSTQPGVGGTVDVTATAADRDPTLALAYQWTASAPDGAVTGTFLAPASPTTRFTCPAGYEGAQTLTITVTNGVSKKPQECPLAKQSILVLCVPTNCGDGVVQASLGEACDLGRGPNGERLNGPQSHCSYACKAPCRCGDGFSDGRCGEQCDDGNKVSCDGCGVTCQLDTPTTCLEGPCVACRNAYRGYPPPAVGCHAQMGCANLSDPTDRTLCQNLLNCLYAHPTCWADDPVTCLCGTAAGLDCASLANGVCRDQAMAAARTSSLAEVFSRFYDTAFPVGHATQEMVCNNKCGGPALCTPVTGGTCGNGLVEAGEVCDDGNTAGCDGCSPLCLNEIPSCGNGCFETSAGETCDDGNNISCDGCSSTCKAEGIPVCGDGIVACGERCDDGNAASGDGCVLCQLVPAICGNGAIETWGAENCDDSNTVDGDGCDHLCRQELAPAPFCLGCRESRRGAPTSPDSCAAFMGCENLADPTDRALCQNLLACMYANPTCWATTPATCFCGTATGEQCNTAPNGVCRDQAVAAAKATDYLNTSLRFFNGSYPVGHATQQLACDRRCVADGITCP